MSYYQHNSGGSGGHNSGGGGPPRNNNSPRSHPPPPPNHHYEQQSNYNNSPKGSGGYPQQSQSYSSGRNNPNPGSNPQQQQYGYNASFNSNNSYPNQGPRPSVQYPPLGNEHQHRGPPPPTQQQTDYAKYQFLPYGQPPGGQPAPPPTSSYPAGFNPYHQQYPTTGSNSNNPYHNQSNPFPPQMQTQAYNNYLAYGQQQQHQAQTQVQGMGGYYNPQQPPCPAPVPAPVPPPTPVLPPQPTKTRSRSPPTQRRSDKDEQSKSSTKPKFNKGEDELIFKKERTSHTESEGMCGSGSSRSQQKAEDSQRQPVIKEEPATPVPPKKSVPIMVGKRKGGRSLPTGVVKKQRPESPVEGKRTDAWSQYMNEVKRYKDRSCEDDGRTNRPLVK